MHILVTGNAGYVGPVLLTHLRRALPGAKLTGYDAGLFLGQLIDTGPVPERTLDVQLFGDVRDIRAEQLDGVDAIIHLAAISNDPMGNEFEDVTLAVNRDATIRLAQLAKDRGVKAFAFASSCSVYGSAEEAERTEDSPLQPLTAYARSKVEAETALQSLASRDFRVTCLRFATACGMSPRLRLDLVLNDFVASARATGAIKILSDGTPWRPLIHVEDMARALEWAIARAGDAYMVLNVGRADWNFQVRELAEAVARVVPAKIEINPDAKPDKRSYRVSFARFRALAPRHTPQWSLDATVRQLADALRDFTDANFRNGQLIRLNVLRDLRARQRVDDHLRWAVSPDPSTTQS